MADSIAVLDACNAGLGIGFYLNQCTTRLCNADNTCQYSASSCSSGGSEIHSCGQLISGIIRSIRKNLAVTLPNTYVDLINKLTLSSILVHTGTAINAQIAIDMLTLDDDDGNINNGTPHYSEICSGFSEKPSQGLGRRWGEVREFTSRTRGGPRPALSIEAEPRARPQVGFKMFKTGPFMDTS